MRRHLPALFYLAAAAAVVLAVIFPLWRVLLYFPQYPEGPLQLVAYTSRLAGDLAEIAMLNHYIGVALPSHIPELEILPKLLYGIAAWAVVSALVQRRIGLWLKGGTIAGIAACGAWMFWRINSYLTGFGANPDPNAPLAGVVRPFKPPLWGRAVIVQVEAVAEFLNGSYFLALAVGLLIIGFWLALRQLRAGNNDEADVTRI